MTAINNIAAFNPAAFPSVGIGGAGNLGGASGLNGTGQAEQTFKNVLLESLNQVNGMQQEADLAVKQLVTGGDVNPAEVLTTLQKADMSFRLMMQIRNKLVQAYQEVSNIRI